jgi:glycosyltransferase involved in cell wall biosynthesis
VPLVSILIPSYNHARFLPACLDSIRAQTFTDREVVLVDDGSKDESVAIARDYAAKDPRIHVHVNGQNLGTYGTEQKALELSKGELVAVMNSDDLWAPEKLERQIALLEKHPEAPYCYTLGWMVDDEGKVDETEDIHADWPRDELQQPLPYLLYENRILASSVLWRREGLRFETSCRYSGDWVALLEQSPRGPAVCISDRLSFWRQHEKNTFRLSKLQALEEIRVRLSIDAAFPKERPNSLSKNALNLQALGILSGNSQLVRRATRRALSLKVSSAQALRRYALFLTSKELARKRLWKGAKIDISTDELKRQELLSLRPRPG